MNRLNSNVHNICHIVVVLILGVCFLAPVNLSVFSFDKSLKQVNSEIKIGPPKSVSAYTANSSVDLNSSYQVTNFESVMWEHHEEELIIKQNAQLEDDYSNRYIISVIVSPWQSNGRLTVDGGSAIAFAGGSNGGLLIDWLDKGDAWLSLETNLGISIVDVMDNSLLLSYYSIRQGYISSSNTIKTGKTRKQGLSEKIISAFFLCS